MAKIIKQRERVTVEHYVLHYERRDTPGSGFSFDCDKDGNVFPLENPAAQENYAKCVSGEHDVECHGVRDWSHSYSEPAVLECHCGAHVQLYHFTNTCDACGCDYNMGGQQLAPREFWGEETGEHWTDCI